MTETTRIEKACPVVLRRSADGLLQFLAFQHPMAGLQVVKGTIEAAETAKDAAKRKLLEESGIAITANMLDLGKSNGIQPDESWHFFLCSTAPLSDTFDYQSTDDSGHTFSFFFEGFEDYFGDEWDTRFIRAIRFIQTRVDKIPTEKLEQFVVSANGEITNAILAMAREKESRNSFDPSEVARNLAGNNEKEWRKLMKPIRNEAVRLAKQGDITISRKGKPVDPDNFKGLYKLSAPE